MGFERRHCAVPHRDIFKRSRRALFAPELGLGAGRPPVHHLLEPFWSRVAPSQRHRGECGHNGWCLLSMRSYRSSEHCARLQSLALLREASSIDIAVKYWVHRYCDMDTQSEGGRSSTASSEKRLQAWERPFPSEMRGFHTSSRAAEI